MTSEADDDVDISTFESEGGAGSIDGESDASIAAREVALGTASATRLSRQAFMHGVDRQLFTFLFANCLFLAGALAAWEKALPGVDADPSGYVYGLDTVRGAIVFALAIYGFFTCVTNVFFGQVRVWPFLLNAVVALTVGIGGISAGIDKWDAVKTHLAAMPKTILFDEISYRVGAFAPGPLMLALGGFLVVWVILTGLMKGASASKSANAGPAGGKRRRR